MNSSQTLKPVTTCLLPRYHRYLGQIPNHWRVERIKYHVHVNKETLREDTDENLEIQYIDISSVDSQGRILETQRLRFGDAPSRARRKVFKGDTIVSTVRTYLKAISYIDSSDSNLVCSTGFAVLSPKSTLHPKFLAYYARSTQFIDEVMARSVGVSYPAVNASDVADIFCPIPPQEEQELIVDFLDRETAKLDQLIEKKQRLIELLQEYRQALITQAVTKGLDPNVPMKDSGVPWLGEVPAHWKVTKIKYVSSKIGSGKTPKGGSNVYIENGVLFIRSQNVHFDGLRLEDVVYIDEETNREMSGTQVRDNDVLLNITGASIGRCCLVPEGFPRANVNQHVCIIRPITTKILPGFLHAVVCSEAVQHQIDIINHGTSREGLNFDQTGNLVFAYPEDLEEQREIYQFIVDKTKRIDSLVAKLRLQIEKIQEYRQALICAAVTGQIDVRQSLTKEPEGITS